jgi:tetratricopeptide (TPR) repeat protein
MNWKIAAIAGVAILGLLVIAGAISIALGHWINQIAGADMKACHSTDPDTSIKGCTAVIAAGNQQGKKLANTYLFRAAAYQKKKDYSHSVEDSSRSIGLDGTVAAAFFERANGYDGLKNYDAAIADYTTALKIKPGLSNVYMERSLAHAANKQYAEAISDQTSAIEQNGENEGAWASRGLERATLGQFKDAMSDCNHALELKPSEGLALDCQAFTYLRMHKYAEALADYNGAIPQFPKNGGWFYCRSICKRGTGDAKGAEADLKSATQLEPGVIERYKQFGISWPMPDMK